MQSLPVIQSWPPAAGLVAIGPVTVQELQSPQTFAPRSEPQDGRGQPVEQPPVDLRRGGWSPDPVGTPKHSEPASTVEMLPVPDTRQSTTYSCGASALQAVLMYYGEERLETELMELLHTDPANGTNPRAIVQVARDLGFQAELKDRLTFKDLEDSLRQKAPVIVAGQAWRDGDDLDKPWAEVWGSGHYMVVIGSDEHNFYFEDPSLLGSRGVMTRDEFEQRWHDIDDVPYVHSGIFITGRKPSPPPMFIHID
jgi:uncharacterized protein